MVCETALDVTSITNACTNTNVHTYAHKTRLVLAIQIVTAPINILDMYLTHFPEALHKILQNVTSSIITKADSHFNRFLIFFKV